MVKRRIFSLCLMAMMGVLMTVSKQAMQHLPNFEPVSLLVILFTLVFGVKLVAGAVAVFLLTQGLLYGFGIWWFMYLYIWPLLALLARSFRWMDKAWQWAILSGLYGLAFGALCSLVYLPQGVTWMISWIISGLPYDAGHAVGNFLLALVLYRPLRLALEKLKKSMTAYLRE